MPPCDVSDERQAETVAWNPSCGSRSHANERLEDTLAVFNRHAGAVIADEEHSFVARFKDCHSDETAELEGIRDRVGNQRPEQHHVAIDHHFAPRFGELQTLLVGRRQLGGHVFDDILQRDELAWPVFVMTGNGQNQQPLHERLELDELGSGARQVSARLRAEPGALGQQLELATNARQRRAELVRGICREALGVLHFVCDADQESADRLA